MARELKPRSAYSGQGTLNSRFDIVNMGTQSWYKNGSISYNIEWHGK